MHFTRAGVGEPFLVAASEFERATGIAVHTVLSSRYDSEARGAKAMARRLLGRDGLFRRRGSVRWITDVNAEEFLSTLGGDAHGIVTYFDQIFRPPAIERFASLVNFHGSVLPYYRGPVPTRWVVHNGEKRTGITLHDIDTSIDAGRIRYQSAFDVPPGDREQLDIASTMHMVPVFRKWLEHVGSGAPFAEATLDADSIYHTKAGYLPAELPVIA